MLYPDEVTYHNIREKKFQSWRFKGETNGFGRHDKINNWYEVKYITLGGKYTTSDCSIAARASRQTSVYFYPLFYKAQTGLMPQNTNNYIASILQKAYHTTFW